MTHGAEPAGAGSASGEPPPPGRLWSPPVEGAAASARCRLDLLSLQSCPLPSGAEQGTASEDACFNLEDRSFTRASASRRVPGTTCSSVLNGGESVVVRRPGLKWPSAGEALRVKLLSCPGTFGDFDHTLGL